MIKQLDKYYSLLFSSLMKMDQTLPKRVEINVPLHFPQAFIPLAMLIARPPVLFILILDLSFQSQISRPPVLFMFSHFE